MTAVEWLINEINMQYPKINVRWKGWVIDKAKEMEENQKIQFACKVVEVSSENYIQGKTTEQIAKELLTFKLK
jgi:hypothetical protein